MYTNRRAEADMGPSKMQDKRDAVGFRFIISPAKKMNVVEGPPWPTSTPVLLDRTRELMDAVRALSYKEAKTLWKTSDRLTELNYARFSEMDLGRDTTAAVISYEGIQYQHLAPHVMDERGLAYLDRHLRILSGFYGVLRPGDGVVPYRLEMQAKLAVGGARDLYEYWGPALAEEVSHGCDTIANLASVEYAKAVVPYAKVRDMRVVTCLFGELKGGRLVQRSTEAKAARGTFVRWCAEHGVEDVSDFTAFSERGYALDETRSETDTLVFVRR